MTKARAVLCMIALTPTIFAGVFTGGMFFAACLASAGVPVDKIFNGLVGN